MKKIKCLLSTALLCLFISFTYSQTENIEWFDGFESGGGDWAASNGVWDVGIPTSGPNAAYNSTYCAATVLTGYYPATANTRLEKISFISIPEASQNPRLRFWYWSSFSTADFGRVQIKPEGGTDWLDISANFYLTSSNVWSYQSIDLSEYSGQSVQIAFYFYATDPYPYNNYSTGWYIDNVSLVTGPYNFNNPETWEAGIGDWYVENGTWEVGQPTSGPGHANSFQNCVATNLNGNYARTVNSRLVSPPVDIGDANQNPRLRFWHWFSFSTSDYGIVQIKNTDSTDWIDLSTQFYNTSSNVWSIYTADLKSFSGQNIQFGFKFYASDPYPYNNYSTGWYIDDISIETGSILFNNPEDWEMGIGNWYAENGAWEAGSPTSGPNAAHSYTNCVATVLDGNYARSVNSRLISSETIIPDINQNPRLSFWHWYSISTADYGIVQIKNVDSTSWINISNSINNTSSNTWSKQVIDLTPFSGQSVQLAFRFYASDPYPYNNYSTGWYIDDVSIELGPILFNNPEDWEMGIGNWYVESGTWEVGLPTSGPNGAYSDENCVATVLDGNYAKTVSSRFISPFFYIVESIQNPRLTFQHWFSFSTADYGRIQIKPADSLNWTDLTTNFTGLGTTWSYGNINLSDYAEQFVQIAFLFHASDPYPYNNISTGWYIDDVIINDDSDMTVDVGDDFTLPYGSSQMLIANVIGGTYPYAFEWTPEGGLSDPTSQIPFASPIQTTTYHLKVTDDNGSYRTDNITIYVPYTLELTAFLEGSYDGPLMTTDLYSGDHLPLDQPYDMAPWNYNGDESVTLIPNGEIVDWVLVELRETNGDATSAKYFTKVDRFAAFLKRDGSIVDTDGSSTPEITVPISDNLYVVIWHRNHLEIMSSNAVPMASGHFSYDLSSSSSVIYGGSEACKQLDAGVWGMVSGDGNSTGNINNPDKNDEWLQQYGLSGYYKGDYNLDGTVDDSDKNDFWIPNVGLGTQVE